MTTGKTIALTIQTFVGKVMCFLFDRLSSSSKEQASLYFMDAVTIYSNFGAQKTKSVTVSIVYPSICHEIMWLDAMILAFWMLSFKPAFSLSSFTFIQRLYGPLHFLPFSSVQFSSVQLLSHVPLFAIPWIAARQASLSIAISWSLLKLMPIKLVMPFIHLILCLPLLLLPPIPPSIRVFSNESSLRIMWPKYWSFSFSIGPSNEHPGLNSFRMDCLDLLAVQGTLKSSPTPE